MSVAYGASQSDHDNISVIHRALELGVTFLDTSDVYGPFTNEELVGEWCNARALTPLPISVLWHATTPTFPDPASHRPICLPQGQAGHSSASVCPPSLPLTRLILRHATGHYTGKAIAGQRDKYVLATKCGILLKNGQMTYDGSRAHVRAACEASLRRLGTDVIDLYYLHRVDPATPVQETFAEMKVQAQGPVNGGRAAHEGVAGVDGTQGRTRSCMLFVAHAVVVVQQIHWLAYPWQQYSYTRVCSTCPGQMTGSCRSLQVTTSDQPAQ
jgi:aryl-alcohol dehydrogenase-like predicted oxidoreductase